MSIFLKALKNPLRAYNHLQCLFRGMLYKFYFRLTNKNVTIGKHFKVKKRLYVKGPGKIIIGDNVTVDGTVHTVTPWTSSKDAVISIGDGTFINGARFSCKTKIEIGRDCILADIRVIDVDYHSVYPHQRSNEALIESRPIIIGNNVWIAMQSIVLKGVTIGDNVTISAGSVVVKDIPPDCIAGGNPAKVIRKLTTEELL